MVAPHFPSPPQFFADLLIWNNSYKQNHTICDPGCLASFTDVTFLRFIRGKHASELHFVMWTNNSALYRYITDCLCIIR